MTFLIGLLIILMMARETRAQETWHIGIMMGPTLAHVSDPDGSTDTQLHFFYLNFISTIPFGRDQRIFSQLFYDQCELDASTSNIGQKVSTSGGNVSWQYLWRLSRYWKPWIGGGVGFANSKFKSRHLLDADGFLIRQFPGRSENILNLIVNASIPLTQWGRFQLGTHMQYEFPTGDGIHQFLFGLTLLY